MSNKEIMDEERGKLWRTFKKNRTALVGTVIIMIVIAVAVLAPWISPHDPLEQNMLNRLKPPDRAYLLGTDEYGRDVLSRVLWGARVSLAVGILSILFGLLVGTVMGTIAGYRGAIAGSLIMGLVDVLLSFPVLISGILVVAILGPGMDKLILTMGIVFAPRFARLAYGPTLVIKEREYVDSARVIGVRTLRILSHYVFPNIFGGILVAATLWVGTAILTEASLSFLGLGISPPTPTWGNMIKSGIDRLTTAPWLSISPGLSILTTVLAINMIGDGLRDITDPKLRI
ncbi:MAG: ABC transporter permease [Syntrophales bacterium]